MSNRLLLSDALLGLRLHMESNGVETIEKLLDAAQQLRDRVNYKRRHSALIQNSATWNTLCSAMDVVGDTCQALRSYSTREALHDGDTGAAYLLAYGVLHSLYLQQDAVFWWCKSLDIKPVAGFATPGAWVRSVQELEAARQARTDSVGHPVRRDKPRTLPLAAFFIVQHSLSDKGFQLIKHEADQLRSEWSYVSFPSLIADQVRVLTDVIEKACEALDAEDRNHYEKFMQTPLTPILNSLDYPIQKLGAKRTHSDWQLMPAHVDEIRTRLMALKTGIETRSEPFDESWQWAYRKLECALGRLKDYATAGALDTDDDLADVLADYVRCAVDDLRERAKELDELYSGR